MIGGETEDPLQLFSHTRITPRKRAREIAARHFQTLHPPTEELMKGKLPPILALLLLGGCAERGPLAPADVDPELSGPTLVRAQAATTIVSEQEIPIHRTPFAACLNEQLTVTGTRYVRTRTTIDASGGMHVQLLINDRGWRAAGQTSGEGWTLVAGMAPLSFTASGHTPQVTFTWAGGQVFRPDNPSLSVLLFHGPEHFTVNAQGEVTVDFDKYQMFICRGSG
jgi:hypothetical protein